jgi:methylated-DNA-protein-cysteine methyltransferase related protein
MNAFSEKVIQIIKKIPKGRVATYQQVAGLAGKIHASRAVAWILNSSSEKHKLPWHRVISKKGRVAFKPLTRNFKLQSVLLKKEGVVVDPKTGEIDMDQFQYKKHARSKKRKLGQPRMFND